jgi:antitoxin CptB
MNKEILIKQLLYRSKHRGCKETDILLGKFAEEKITNFSDEKLNLYQKFIDEDDLMIYDWILGKYEVADDYIQMVDEVRKFHNI